MWIYISIYVCTNEDGYILYLQDSYHRGYDESTHTGKWKILKHHNYSFHVVEIKEKKSHIKVTDKLDHIKCMYIQKIPEPTITLTVCDDLNDSILNITVTDCWW